MAPHRYERRTAPSTAATPGFSSSGVCHRVFDIDNSNHSRLETRMLLIALVSFFFLTFVVPLVRLWLRHRVVGVRLRNRSGVERLIGGFLVAAYLGLVVWVVAGPRAV